MDNEAFLPVHPDELTNQAVARRLVNYSDLVDPITDQLVDNQVASKKGVNATHSWYTAGRYLRVFRAEHVDVPEHQYSVWFGVDINLWSTYGITPLWLHRSNVIGDAGEIQAQFILQGFQDVQCVDSVLYFPIRIKPGVERDDVVGDAVNQLTNFANILNDLDHPG